MLITDKKYVMVMLNLCIGIFRRKGKMLKCSVYKYNMLYGNYLYYNVIKHGNQFSKKRQCDIM